MTKNNKKKLFVFEVGPSVKFVSAIKDAIFNKNKTEKQSKDALVKLVIYQFG